ncbi:uncharacterized protein HKW66_Vig0036290 [Vigna angularis]|uniref:Calmodulin-lysine N-methyltransferase n=1 Tax=Phaseolus angularis TaxID=3914 RepID=A0A8T0L9P9_PHAAN|nr:uncharacterized protein HKW66_Vig0036290 [Vigna angularis]
MDNTANVKASSLRWKILRRALLSRATPPDSEEQSHIIIKRISRRTSHGFNLIPSHVIDDERHPNKRDCSSTRDTRVCYTLPISDAPQLFLTQRVDSRADLDDFEICNRYNIDNTGLVCNWPSEDVLAHYCLSHADIFRSKKVIELGSGYGLAGFVIAAATGASEVVISDGNPQVVDCILLCDVYLYHGKRRARCSALVNMIKMIIPSRRLALQGEDTQRNIEANTGAFGDTVVKSMTLHWNQEDITNLADTFDIIIASDCTFFKDFHRDLARIVKHLLSKAGSSEAIFLSPKRGNSLDLFLELAKENGLRFSVTENYDQEVWKRHEGFLSEDRDSWPSYEKGHSYPLLIRITL